MSAPRTPPLTVSCVPLTTVTTNTVIAPCTLVVTSAPGDAVCLTMTAKTVKNLCQYRTLCYSTNISWRTGKLPKSTRGQGMELPCGGGGTTNRPKDRDAMIVGDSTGRSWLADAMWMCSHRVHWQSFCCCIYSSILWDKIVVYVIIFKQMYNIMNMYVRE